MKSESTVRPALVEKYPSLVRINYGVVEEQRNDMDNEGTTTFYLYQMLELEHINMKLDDLVSLLIADRYTLEEQIRILTGDNTSDIAELTAWRAMCKRTAREILDIPQTVENARSEKIADINMYDVSQNVNLFYFQGIPMWLDKATRVGLMNSITIEKNAGVSETTLWLGAMSITIQVDTAISMLASLEIYAHECYNVTARHIAEVNALETIEDIEGFDITQDYPAKLEF